MSPIAIALQQIKHNPKLLPDLNAFENLLVLAFGHEDGIDAFVNMDAIAVIQEIVWRLWPRNKPGKYAIVDGIPYFYEERRNAHSVRQLFHEVLSDFVHENQNANRS